MIGLVILGQFEGGAKLRLVRLAGEIYHEGHKGPWSVGSGGRLRRPV